MKARERHSQSGRFCTRRYHASSRVTCEHLVALQCIGTVAGKRIIGRELALGDEVGVGPYSVLGVIRKVFARRERVPEVGSIGVIGLGDRDTVEECRPPGALCSCRCGLCSRALGMPTVARDLHRTCRVMAVVAAVFRAALDEAVARRVRAFLLFLLSHGWSSYSPFGR